MNHQTEAQNTVYQTINIYTYFDFKTRVTHFEREIEITQNRQIQAKDIYIYRISKTTNRNERQKA